MNQPMIRSMNQLMIRSEDAPGFLEGLRTEYQTELDNAQKDLETARHRGGRHIAQLRRAQRRVVYAEMKLEALNQGFLPVPRMPVEKLEEWYLDKAAQNAPEAVVERLKDAIAQGLFTSYAIVRPEDRRRRDPLLIGIVRLNRSDEEHFLIAWWR